jgi:hypothetical protein
LRARLVGMRLALGEMSFGDARSHARRKTSQSQHECESS